MMSTRVADMVPPIAKVVLPLRRWEAHRERLELLLALTIGAIPAVAAAMRMSNEAAAARGVRPRLTIVVPSVLVTILRLADQLGEAQLARGL